LLSLIAEHQLHPGDKLPPERDLAAAMHVSRASLREALRALAMLKIVEIRQGSGTYVSSLKPELLVERLDFVFALDDSTFAEALEARLLIEPGIAALAACRATDAALRALAECTERAQSAVDDPAAFLSADIEFHQIITTAAHNQIIARFMVSLARLGAASRGRTVEIPGVRRHAAEHHGSIGDALVRRDAEAAAATMRHHLEYVHQSLTQDAEPLTSGGPSATDYDMG
jgi:GntR family transcriptional regulator, transcriptional repressor for pyruvate dehydrogenase complex